MTAKELKDNAWFQNTSDGEVTSEGYIFSIEDFAIFWSQLCKEQRKLCLKSHIDQLAEEFGDFVYELSEDKTDCAILNAPEPEIE